MALKRCALGVMTCPELSHLRAGAAMNRKGCARTRGDMGDGSTWISAPNPGPIWPKVNHFILQAPSSQSVKKRNACPVGWCEG